jgi:hypothetical protein
MTQKSISLKVTVEKFELAKAELAKLGFPIESNVGVLTHRGVTIEYKYNFCSEILQLTLVKKPWYIPMDYLETELRNQLAKYEIEVLYDSSVKRPEVDPCDYTGN